MNTQDELERMLGRELHDRADGLGGAGFGLAEVKGRAGRIRRNRRIASGVGVAAALAVIIPVAITAGGALQSKGSLDPVRQPDQPVEVARTSLTTQGLPRGDAPRVEYFTADGVVLPGEGVRALPENYQALVPSAADGGWIALSPSKDEIRYLTEDFGPQGGSSTTQALVSNPDRSLVTWVMPESGAQTLYLHSTVDAGVGTAWDFPESPTVAPVDLVSEGSVLYAVLEPDGSPTYGIAEADGSLTELPGIVKAISANPATGMVAVQTRSKKDASGCFGVLDPATSTTEPVWETCDYSLGAFSADGRYVLASGPMQSGAGPTEIHVLDAATGQPVALFRPASSTQVTLRMVVWETATTFVAVAAEGDTITLLRFGVDGTLEETVDPVRGDPFGDLPFWIGADRVRGF